MTAMGLHVGAVLTDDTWIAGKIQASSDERGWFASLHLEDGQYGGHFVSLIMRDTTTVSRLITELVTVRAELLATEQSTDRQVPSLT